MSDVPNQASRAMILNGIRRALHRGELSGAERQAVEARLAQPPRGPTVARADLPQDQKVALFCQWAELNNSPNWSAFHLYKMGEIVPANAVMCPKTMALIDGAPKPDQPGRTPAAMFSLLKPKTRIPPHTGVSNVRLVTHVPLIIPERCGFRVGNETRQWQPGKAWVFDDTIEHEAWNDSDKLRVVLIFDIWHPHLTQAERAMITAMTVGMNAFSNDVSGFDL